MIPVHPVKTNDMIRQLLKQREELVEAVHALKELLEVDYEPGSEEDDTWLVLIQVDELLTRIEKDLQ